ncbi:MAG: hypothetical protein ACI358_07015 [Candidatus Limimorpha sp.]
MRKYILELLFLTSFILSARIICSNIDSGHPDFYCDCAVHLAELDNSFDGEMLLPQNELSVPAPSVHYSFSRRLARAVYKFVPVKNIIAELDFVGYRFSPQAICCFSSHNELFVLKMRHIIV